MDAKLVAAWIGIATGVLAIITFFLSILQRRKELRWKQAELARKLLDDVFADTDAAQGFYMLDGVRYPFKISMTSLLPCHAQMSPNRYKSNWRTGF